MLRNHVPAALIEKAAPTHTHTAGVAERLASCRLQCSRNRRGLEDGCKDALLHASHDVNILRSLPFSGRSFVLLGSFVALSCNDLIGSYDLKEFLKLFIIFFIDQFAATAVIHSF